MKPVHLIPLGIFLLIAIALAIGLSLKPKEIPSALIAEPAPTFDLDPLHDGAARFSDADLRKGERVLVNVFASWCGPCIIEHPQLTALAEDLKIPIYGINQKDKVEDAKRFLERHGDIFTLIGRDPDGRASIEWGVYGLPESFVVDGDGTILFKHVGPILASDLEKIIPFFTNQQAGE